MVSCIWPASTESVLAVSDTWVLLIRHKKHVYLLIFKNDVKKCTLVIRKPVDCCRAEEVWPLAVFYRSSMTVEAWVASHCVMWKLPRPHTADTIEWPACACGDDWRVWTPFATRFPLPFALVAFDPPENKWLQCVSNTLTLGKRIGFNSNEHFD